jgi:F0F1-type ATP synthase membrane subunit b/b'
MPDKPMISKAALRTGESGADVLHEALAMRQEAERELAEAGDRRSRALAEATQVLNQARAAAATLAEEAEADAHRIVQQAREQAMGIVARAREEAEQLLADAHADAAQFDAWARQEAQAGIQREVAAAHQALEVRRTELDLRLSSLRSALDQAVGALEETATLPSLFLDPAAEPADTESAVHYLRTPTTAQDDVDVDVDVDPGVETNGSGPAARMTLVTAPLATDAEPDAEPEADPAVDAAADAGVDAELVAETDETEPVDDEAGDPVQREIPAPAANGTLVRTGAKAGSTRSAEDPADTTVDGFGEADTLLIEAEREDEVTEDDGARPLGWLFRSPPM